MEMGKEILTFMDIEIEKKKIFTILPSKGQRYCESISI